MKRIYINILIFLLVTTFNLAQESQNLNAEKAQSPQSQSFEAKDFKGRPAARLGDMTLHGGSITLGLPSVLIGGMPAARLGDMHVCPMVTPGTPPIPHVGGPITLGSPVVLIGGMPAARMGDMCICVGPPDQIAIGWPTVLIGEGGSDSASIPYIKSGDIEKGDEDNTGSENSTSSEDSK